MTGIVTYAYLYLHGENRLQFFGRLRDRELLLEFLGKTQEGALLYSGYRPPEHSLLTDLSVLAGACKGVTLCPVTEALIRRHGMAEERLAGACEGGFFSLGGTPLDKAGTVAPESALGYADLPPDMQATLAFKQAFQQHPEAAGQMLDEGITCMADFQKKWAALPGALANTIAKNHYLQTARDALENIPSPTLADKRALASACIKIASGFPPWVDTWDLVTPYLDVRSSNVLRSNVVGGPHALAAMTPKQMIGLPSFGTKSLRVTFKALSEFSQGNTDLLALTVTDTEATLLEDAHSGSLPNASQGTPYVVFRESDALTVQEILDDPHLPSTLQNVVDNAFVVLHRACEMLDIKPHAYLEAISARLKGDTLEACGKRFGVTREAIRQNEIKVLKWLAGAYPRMLDRLEPACASGECDSDKVALYRDIRALATIQFGMVHLLDKKADDTVQGWLSLLTTSPNVGAIKNEKLLFEVLSVSPVHGTRFPGNFGIFTHGFSREGAPEEAILLPLPPTVDASDVQRFIHGTLLPSLVGLDSEMACTTGRALLIQHGLPQGVANLLMTFAQIHWLMQDEGGKTYLPYATSEAVRERQEALELIRRAKRPLHIVENIFRVIRPGEVNHPRPHALAGNWIDSLQNQLHSSDLNYPVLVGNSYIATINQLGLASENVGECAAYMESIMAQSPRREFSTRELMDELKSANVPSFNWPDTWPDHPRIPTHNIAHVILINQRNPNTRNMGRFVWKYGPWTDEADTENRTQIYDVYKDLFRERRQPIRARDLLDAVAELRGRGTSFEQIHEINGLVRLEGSGREALFWDTDLGPWPCEAETQDPAPASVKSESSTEDESDETGDEEEAEDSCEDGADVDAESRDLVHDTCKALFKKRGMPIRESALIEAVEREQGRKINFDQIQAIDGLVHIQGSEREALFWDTDLDPWDDEQKRNVEALQARVIQKIKVHGASIPVSRLVGLFHDFYDLLLPLKDLEKALLLARHPELKMHLGPRMSLTIDLADGKEMP